MTDYDEPKDRRAEIPDALWDDVKRLVEEQHRGFEMKLLVAVDGEGNPIDIESPSNKLFVNSLSRSAKLIKWKCKNGYWHYTQIVGGQEQEFRTTLRCS